LEASTQREEKAARAANNPGTALKATPPTMTTRPAKKRVVYNDKSARQVRTGDFKTKIEKAHKIAKHRLTQGFRQHF
jgi:xanthine dehydrogenase molybdopterin-binding subunit B